jgi:S-formylglutathione hydrolase FrmB
VLSPEAFILSELLPWLEARYALPPRSVALAGTEMGGHGAVRLALRHPERVPIAASISGAMDMHEWHGRGTPLDTLYESRERARLDTAVLHVNEREWPRHLWFACGEGEFAVRGNDRLHEKLSAMGVPHVADLRATGSQLSALLAFVSAALAQEAKRLM